MQVVLQFPRSPGKPVCAPFQPTERILRVRKLTPISYSRSSKPQAPLVGWISPLTSGLQQTGLGNQASSAPLLQRVLPGTELGNIGAD